jgi:very-short-patch-repair endonuclease
VELDGEIHETQQDRDAELEELLRAAGYHILRLTNREVLTDFSSTMTRIQSAAESLAQREAYPIARTQGW